MDIFWLGFTPRFPRSPGGIHKGHYSNGLFDMFIYDIPSCDIIMRCYQYIFLCGRYSRTSFCVKSIEMTFGLTKGNTKTILKARSWCSCLTGNWQPNLIIRFDEYSSMACWPPGLMGRPKTLKAGQSIQPAPRIVTAFHKGLIKRSPAGNTTSCSSPSN